MPVFIIATLDTKGAEAAFVRDCLRQAGVSTCLVDAGCLGQATVAADISREEVFEAAGTRLSTAQERGDRGEAVARAAAGVAQIIRSRHVQGEVEGVLALGGSAGTTIGTSAMRVLPLGTPKVMVSTLASGQVRPYVGGRDIMMLYSVVDILGLNRISRRVMSRAAAAMAGMVQSTVPVPVDEGRPLVAATMFGVTTPCVERAREVLETAGYEVLVFHATGIGGETMEGLIRDGLLQGVLDITTTEIADEIVGGVLSAGPDRLTAAAQTGLPQVVSVGATDMVNFLGMASVPERFRDRRLYRHNENVTLMRTTPDENALIGADLGRKVAQTTGPAAILLPRQGVSALDALGQPFDDPDARGRLFGGIREHAGGVEVLEYDHHINDARFAEEAAENLLRLMRTTPTSP